MRPSLSFRSTTASSDNSEHVRCLEDKIEQIEASRQSKVKQMASMMAWLHSKGYQERDSSGKEGASWLVIISKVLIYVNKKFKKLLEINGW